MRLEIIKPGPRNVQKAINKLLKSKDTSIVLKTARQWLEIKANPYPYPLVNILLKIISSSENRYEREEAARILLKMSANDQNVTKSIIELFYKQPDEETHRVVAWYLGEIILASSETLRVLIECLSSPIAKSVQRQAIISLGQVCERNWNGEIGFDNLNVIEALKNLLDKTKDEETCLLAAYVLSQTSTSIDKLKAIQTLKKLISSSQYLSIKFRATMVLWQQYPGNINILKILILLLLDNQGNPNFRIHPSTKGSLLQETIARFLKTWVLTEQLPIIIDTIQSYKSTQDAGSLTLYEVYGYSLIWHYAQNLPYDKFYQACRGK